MRPRASLPIVVGGCHRSGTSLVRRVLDSHPRIYCGPEVKFFRDFYGDYIDDPIRHVRFMESVRAILPEDDLFEILGSAFIEMHERAATRAMKPRWADKAPENVVFLEDWERLLGDEWLFLHVVRNPLDTLSSIEEWQFPVSIPAGLDARIDLYLNYLEAGRAFGRANPDRYILLVYETLVSDPVTTVRTLMSELGEQFHARQLAINGLAHQEGLEDPKARRASSIHSGSLGRWREVLEPGAAKLIADRTASAWSAVAPTSHDVSMDV